jgi:hypothetical protein
MSKNSKSRKDKAMAYATGEKRGRKRTTEGNQQPKTAGGAGRHMHGNTKGDINTSCLSINFYGWFIEYLFNFSRICI